MKKVFIDIGGHLGESIEKFYSEILDAKDWTIFSFEPLTYRDLIKNTSKYANVNIIPAAAWIDNKDLTFYIGERKEGLGSTTLRGKLTGDIDYEKPVSVGAIDIKSWLLQLQAEYVVMKINIEGGEYILLPYLVENNLLDLVDELYVETHAEKFESILREAWKEVENEIIENLKKFKTSTCFYINKKYSFNTTKKQDTKSPFSKLDFKNYEEYLTKQKSKLDVKGKNCLWLKEYAAAYKVLLIDCLAGFSGMTGGKTCLCLGARLGTEVEIFNEFGMFAVGIDLNPGEENKYVVTGDASDIQYPENSVNVVYTNSLDHFLKIEKVIEEVKRVLISGGFFIFLISSKQEEDEYDAIRWKGIEPIIDYLSEKGFSLVGRKKLDDILWFSDFIVMKKG